MDPSKNREYDNGDKSNFRGQPVDPRRHSRGGASGSGPASPAGQRRDLRDDLGQPREGNANRDAMGSASQGTGGTAEEEENDADVRKRLSGQLRLRYFAKMAQTQSRGAGSSTQHAEAGMQRDRNSEARPETSGYAGSAGWWWNHPAAGMQSYENNGRHADPRHRGGAGSSSSHAAAGARGGGVRADPTQIWYVHPHDVLSEQALADMVTDEHFRLISLGSAHGPVSPNGQATIVLGQPQANGQAPVPGMHPGAGPSGAHAAPGPSKNSAEGTSNYFWAAKRRADGFLSYGPAHEPPLPTTWQSETGGVWVYQPTGQPDQSDDGPSGGSQPDPEIAQRDDRSIETGRSSDEENASGPEGGSPPRFIVDGSSSRFMHLFDNLRRRRRERGEPEERTRAQQWRDIVQAQQKRDDDGEQGT